MRTPLVQEWSFPLVTYFEITNGLVLPAEMEVVPLHPALVRWSLLILGVVPFGE
jgi:hypothetical protein